MPRSREDLTGQRFNQLVAISPAPKKKWIFRCDCGNEKEIRSDCVKNGNTMSCGCLNGNATPGNAIGPFITRSQARSQGLTYFYVGFPCRNGHLQARYISDGSCVMCAAERNAKPEARARSRKYGAIYRQNNRDEIGRKWRERYNTDIEFRLMDLLRGRFKKVVRGERKTENCRRLVGCSLDELRQHIESQFLPGMTWENRGFDGWHIDHIRPCSSFDLLDPAQQEECFHYTNLQPLWAKDNFSKYNKWEAA